MFSTLLTKKRQLGEKMNPQAIEPRFGQNAGVDWQIAMQLADKSTQQLCPHHRIHHIVLCRGTERYVGPNKSMLPGVAPVRRPICIRRQSTEIHVDDWETWENLSHRKLRRPAVPARVSMTIFAATTPPSAVPTGPNDAQDVSADSCNPGCRWPHESLDHSQSDESMCKRTRVSMIETSQSNTRPTEVPSSITDPLNTNHDTGSNNITPDGQDISQSEGSPAPQQVIDLASQKHGPLFMQLSKEEQAWLLKLHRNLGHPGSAKLLEFLQTTAMSRSYAESHW
jgi:hypothetical protein